MAQNTKHPVAVLQELAIKQRIALPNYQIASQATGTHENHFDFQVSVAGIQVNGSGSSKKSAKYQAAYNALMKLKEMGLYVSSEDFEFKVPLTQQGSPYNTAVNCITNLQNLCLKNKISVPEYYEVSSAGLPHAKDFIYECKILSVKAEGKANSKKMAKQIAAKVMLQKINEVLPDLIVAENEKMKKFTEMDAEALDKSVKCDKPLNTLIKLMNQRNLSYEDIVEDLMKGTEESFKIILDKLNLSYEILPLQANPPTAALTLHTNPPFVVMGMGNSHEEAVQKALKQTFTIMNCFLKKVEKI